MNMINLEHFYLENPLSTYTMCQPQTEKFSFQTSHDVPIHQKKDSIKLLN